MTFTEKLDFLMGQKGIKRSTLAKLSGVPYTTIDGFYKKGSDNIKLSTLKSLASYFDCSLDYLVDDSITINNKPIVTKTSQSELLNNFNKLNQDGKTEAIKRVEELTYIPRYTDETQDYLLVNAAHSIKNALDDDKKHDDALMDNDDIWK